ncbi:MAG TPA: ATP-binding protein [Pyrinomonadaceae bacterium]|nr:ATP-binding protein [Pyrinomonadaceae bacterium]
MRIAVSGTHCSGKSTLVNEFLTARPDFVYEPEPYSVLVEDYGEEFSAEPCVDDFLRQLEFNIERLRQRASGERVIFERCPLDFIAYILALRDLHREEVEPQTIANARELAMAALHCLDLIVFLPLDEANMIAVPADEDPKLRKAVDRQLVAIFGDDEFELPSVEARGSTAQRLRILEGKMKPQDN